MSRPHDDTDDFIRRALEKDEAETLGKPENPSATDLLTEAFRGRNRRLAVGGAVVNLVLFLAAVFCGVRFLAADEPGEMLPWGMGMLLAFMTVIAIKVWYWLEMNRLAITREVKRLELQVARIAERLES